MKTGSDLGRKPNGRHGRRLQETDCPQLWLTRERAELEGTLVGREVTRSFDRPEASHRRRGPWDSGRRCRRSFRPRVPSVVGYTRRPTSSISCPNCYSHEPKRCSTRSGWPTSARRPTQPSMEFRSSTESNPQIDGQPVAQLVRRDEDRGGNLL